MSDERWIPVSGDGWNACEGSTEDDPIYGPELAKIGEAWWAAEGQRVESIRWCETHKNQALGTEHYCDVAFVNTLSGATRCRIVEATLILPPKEQS